nr:TetR/AcrR family transcriptional regulator [Aestuariivirga litoralis]
MNAGEQALTEMPVDKVSLREIARRAGVSHAAPKHHFPSLGHLLAEIAARGFSRFIAALDEGADTARDQTPAGRLTAMGRAYLQFATDNPAVYQLMFGQREPMVMTPRLTEASYDAWQQIVNAVAAVTGQARAPMGAIHVWSSVHGLSLLKLAQRIPPDVPLHNVAESQVRMLIEGLQAE